VQPRADKTPARLLFVFTRGCRERAENVCCGLEPAEAYGLFALEGAGVDVEAVDETLGRRGLGWARSQAYQRWYVIPRSGLGYRIHQAHAVARHVRDDPRRWVVATTDSIGLPMLALKARRRLPNPVAMLSLGLAERLRDGLVQPSLVRRYSTLLRLADVLLVFSPEDGEVMAELAPATTVRVMPCGTDVGWWSGGGGEEAEPGTVVSVGRDLARDFATLAAAVAPLDVRTTIISPLARRQGVEETPKLRIESDAPISQIRTAFRRSQLVVVPIRRVLRPAGQATALQAMAAGRPTIVHDTGWARHAGLRDGEHFFDVEPERPEALRRRIEDVLALPDGGAEVAARAREAISEHSTPNEQAAVILAAIEAAGS
jgi:glycosyltransferase involved in cell wall biosynthesis